MSLERLVYASRATFALSRSGIEPEVGRILMQSRRHNPRRGLVGGLYFGDGHFFQCLEGEAAAIDKLMALLATDPRHTEITVLRRDRITESTFAGWGMKYVPNATEVKRLLAQHGQNRFDPAAFPEAMTTAMVELMRRGPDDGTPPGAIDPAAQPHARGQDRVARGLGAVALLISLLALAISLVG